MPNFRGLPSFSAYDASAVCLTTLQLSRLPKSFRLLELPKISKTWNLVKRVDSQVQVHAPERIELRLYPQ